jgi:hypothetical protein
VIKQLRTFSLDRFSQTGTRDRFTIESRHYSGVTPFAWHSTPTLRVIRASELPQIRPCNESPSADSLRFQFPACDQVCDRTDRHPQGSCGSFDTHKNRLSVHGDVASGALNCTSMRPQA